ncbi:hypothetical protein ES703_71588 [subsurface metagenome]
MGRLNGPVDSSFFLWQKMKIPFGGGSQGFDGVFEWILVDPVEQVEQKH